MDRETLREFIHCQLEEFTGEKRPRLDDDANLREEAGLDSIDLVSLVVNLQGRFDVQLSTAELENVTRFGDLLDILQAKLAAAKPAA
jgi:acyl carrier protein